MELEGSLPLLQVPVTCPYPERDQSNPSPYIPLPEDPSQYYPPMYAWVFQAVSFPQVSPLKPCIRLSSPLYDFTPYIPKYNRSTLNVYCHKPVKSATTACQPQYKQKSLIINF